LYQKLHALDVTGNKTKFTQTKSSKKKIIMIEQYQYKNVELLIVDKNVPAKNFGNRVNKLNFVSIFQNTLKFRFSTILLLSEHLSLL